MKKLIALGAALLAFNDVTSGVLAASPDAASAFVANCSECHPDGRNVVTPAKDLRLATLRANGIRTAQDIVARMRNPGPGMTRFDPGELPDKQAEAIAAYILATFK